MAGGAVSSDRLSRSGCPVLIVSLFPQARTKVRRETPADRGEAKAHSSSLEVFHLGNSGVWLTFTVFLLYDRTGIGRSRSVAGPRCDDLVSSVIWRSLHSFTGRKRGSNSALSQGGGNGR